MLQIKNICKEYRTGGLVQKALDDVSLNLRDNEFVAILGPSGSGKTTLLNIIGGLDRYDSGDLIINGISTQKYKDRDWDSYRNHTIGFVFQSYNLIPHQTVLANVELALTISGIGKEERKKRAIEALKKVGLGEQLHKKPARRFCWVSATSVVHCSITLTFLPAALSCCVRLTQIRSSSVSALAVMRCAARIRLRSSLSATSRMWRCSPFRAETHRVLHAVW